MTLTIRPQFKVHTMIVSSSGWLHLYCRLDDVEIVRRKMMASIVVGKTVSVFLPAYTHARTHACTHARTHARTHSHMHRFPVSRTVHRHYCVIVIALMETTSPVFVLDYYVRSLVNIDATVTRLRCIVSCACTRT